MKLYFDIRKEFADLVDHMITQSIFQSVVFIATFLRVQSRPLFEPFVIGESDNGHCTST